MRSSRYADRIEAGHALADELDHLAGRPGVVVLALPRGGVPVAAVVAADLAVPLDVLVVRKLGFPGHQELAMGAIASIGGAVVVVRNVGALIASRVSDEAFAEVYARELTELRRREAAYRAGHPAIRIGGRTVVVIDDGLATGATMRAAIAAIRAPVPARLVIAVPIAAEQTCAKLRAQVDELICPWMPHRFRAVEQGYRDFPAISDDEVRRLLAAASAK